MIYSFSSPSEMGFISLSPFFLVIVPVNSITLTLLQNLPYQIFQNAHIPIWLSTSEALHLMQQSGSSRKCWHIHAEVQCGARYLNNMIELRMLTVLRQQFRSLKVIHDYSHIMTSCTARRGSTRRGANLSILYTSGQESLSLKFRKNRQLGHVVHISFFTQRTYWCFSFPRSYYSCESQCPLGLSARILKELTTFRV